MKDNNKKITNEERDRAEWIAKILSQMPESKQQELCGVFKGVELVGDVLRQSKSMDSEKPAT